MLNKITGCESRTVPPLYVLMAGLTGESQPLEKSGKANPAAEKAPQGMSQKTYALVLRWLRNYSQGV